MGKIEWIAGIAAGIAGVISLISPQLGYAVMKTELAIAGGLTGGYFGIIFGPELMDYLAHMLLDGAKGNGTPQMGIYLIMMFIGTPFFGGVCLVSGFMLPLWIFK